ncbi:phenylalanine--tRNA ligase subunit beta [Candidatus Woesearchaeota archaeon]|nr:phenylalanine--tRNA ligase subunit beta [Candidatus Woesearchaeota archaeon]
MPTIELSRKAVEKLMGKRLPDEKLRDRISMLGTDLESVDRERIRVEVFPNRPDMLSEAGFARALSAFIGVKPRLRAYAARQSRYRVLVEPSVQEVRPFTACAVVSGLRFDDERIREVIQLQEKLHTTFCRNRKKAAIGIYPLEHIKWPVRYLAKAPADIRFHPLEAHGEMSAQGILELHPAGKSYGHLLAGKESYPLFVDARDEVLSMPPIINSHRTGRVSQKTRDVFIETSGFDLASQSLLLNIIVTALADLGGKIHVVKVLYPKGYGQRNLSTPDLAVRRMRLSREYANRLLGIALTEKDMAKLLGKMGLGFERGNALIPCYRADVLHPIDLVEDLAIAYGYERFEPALPQVATVGEAAPFTLFQEKVAALLAGLGLLETRSYHLSSRETQLEKMRAAPELVEIERSQNAELSVLRASLLPALMEVLQRNKRHEYPQRLFEMGACFSLDSATETGAAERFLLAYSGAHHKATFTEARQVLDCLGRHLGIQVSVRAADSPSFIPGRSGEIIVNGQALGWIGEVHPAVLSAFSVEQPVSAFELDLQKLFEVKP